MSIPSMFFVNFVRSKLASLLRPWLEEEPHVELKLGFLRSIVSAKSLSFDPSALNPLLEKFPSLVVKRLKVGELSVRISPWSFPSLILEVRGVDVTLAPREPLEGRRVPSDFVARKRKEVIAALDPEGFSLHEIFESILVRASSGNRLTTTLVNLILRCCQIQFTDICIQLQFISESCSCCLKVDNFSLEPQFLDQSSLYRGLVGLLHISGEDTVLAISCSCMEFGLMENDHANWIASLMGPSACVKLNCLQPLDYGFWIPHVNVKISPKIIPMLMVLLDVLSFKEIRTERSGQELWRIAAERTSSWILNSRLSLYKVVNIVLLWSSYVHAYESLLSMIGYHANKTLKENLVNVSKDMKRLSFVKSHWKSLSQLEEKLPAEAVACARRIARHRALSHLNLPDSESNTGFITTLVLKIVALFFLFWKVIRFIFLSAVQVSFMGNASSTHRGVNNLPMLGVVVPELQFCLNLGEVHITLSYANADHAIICGKLGSGVDPSALKFTSFCFTMRYICLDYTAHITTTSFFLALGELKMCLSSLPRNSLMRSNMKGERNPSFKGLIHEAGDESDTIMWGNPAPLYHPSVDDVANPSNTVDNALIFTLENSIGDLWSNWRRISGKYEEMNYKHRERPFVLCELKNFIMDPYIRQECGLLKCSLALGKLNFDLEHSSILFTALLIKQIQHYHHLATCVGRTQEISRSLSVLVENSQIGGEDRLESYTHRMKVAMFSTIPGKNIQIGALIDGPSIRISLQDKLFGATEQDFGPPIAQGNYCYCFSLDIESVEFSVWPASKAYFAQLTWDSSSNEAGLEYLWLKEPRKVDIPKPYTNENFFCQGRTALDVFLRFDGLTVFVDDLEVNQQSPIVNPLSITVQCSTCRDYLHSLTATVNILSMALSASATRASVFLYMDEIWTFLQLFEGMFSVVLSTCNSFETATLGYSQDFIRKLISPARKNTKRNAVKSEAIIESLIIKSTQILVDATFELEAMDVILNDSRGKVSRGAPMNSDGASSSATTYFSIGKKLKIVEMLDLPGSGVGLFLDRGCVQISGEENHLDILINFSGIQSFIFSCQSVLEICTGSAGTSQIKNLLEQSSECLYRFILSNCNFSIHIGSAGATLYSAYVGDALDGFDSRSYRGSATHTVGSNPQSHDPDHALEACHLLTTRTPEAATDCWLLVDIQLGEISLSSCCMRRLAGTCQPNKLKLSIYICKEVQTVNCNIQGGYVFLESSALAMFAHCFQAYFLSISKHPLLLLADSGKSFGEDQLTMRKPNSFSSGEFVSGSVPSGSLSEQGMAFNWVFLQDFTIHISQFSVTLAGKDGSEGEIQELTLEVDMRLKCLTSERKLLFDLNRLTIFTQYLHTCIQYKSKDPLMPHFRPSTIVALPAQIRGGNCNFPSQGTGSVTVGLDVQPTNLPAFQRESLVEKGASGSVKHVSYVLKHMTASIMIEKILSRSEVGFVLLKSDWVGAGSFSGVDLTMTLYEIQMISSLLEPLLGISSDKKSHDLKNHVGSRIQEQNTDPDLTIPDGAIVAIKDLHEHMYFAVEAVGNKYRVGGVLHYTLVSERALFRVKYHRGWWSQGSHISLMSLFAKNNHGEPLRLNSRTGSGFVEISSSDDKRHALWQTFPYKCKSFEDDDDVNSCNTSARRAFHLVNQKNNCAIAFVDGQPEFVKKPGHPFKAKVFNEFPLTNDRRLNVSNESSSIISDSKAQEGSSQVGAEVLGFGSILPHVNITIDEVSLTIFHDISDANSKIPILRGSIKDISIIGQIISSKFRIMGSFSIAIQYMDAQRSLWRDIVSPVCSNLFFKSRITFLDRDNVYQGVPAHLFFSVRQMDLYLTEVSVDVLLYLVGKLNIAGPYAVRTSMIFPNFCKIENHSGLTLLCHFPDKQDVRLAGKQSASIFLRHATAVDCRPESENSVSVCLSEQGTFSTSPINVSLSNGCFFAWRTRAVSLQDSRSFPGPFIVVEVSQKTEEGLFLGVSPLLRTSNESGFSMELRFQRSHETEGECATIMLRNGDTIDDSMAVFDALELSGGSRRALMSLTLGNFRLSVRPEITEKIENNGESVSVEWSEDLQGGKALCLFGIFDKLNYRFRKVFGVESVKSFFSTLCCPLLVEGRQFSDLHFLVQTIARDVPVMQPPNVADTSDIGTSPVVLQVQKEIFVYPTVHVYNLLQTEILVLVTENHPDRCMTENCNYIGKQATLPCGSSALLYPNPAIMYFTVSLTAYSSKCKPVSSADWVKKLHKEKSKVQYVDTELDFGGGMYAFLRLSRTDNGFLEVMIFSSYTFQNNTEFTLLCSTSSQKPIPWDGLRNSNLRPELGCLLPPKAAGSWFLKSSKIHLKRFEEKASVSVLDLDILSGFTEICLEAQDDLGFSHITKLAVSLQPCVQKAHVPSQVVCIVPRYVVANESKEPIFIRQCYLQDDLGEITLVEGKQKVALQIRNKTSKREDASIIDSVLKRHRSLNGTSQVFIQFRPKEVGFSWSGPVCVASLGRFFLKFKGSSDTLADQSNTTILKEKKSTQFALIQVVEECSSLVLHFYLPANAALPYRIENCLRGASVMYYQKDSVESDTLWPGDSVEYAWDDLSLPHKLVVQVIDLHLVREINFDKVCSWKPLLKMRQQKVMVLHSPLAKGFGLEKRTDESDGLEVFNVGYEVYADGPTRVLRICERADSYKEEKVLQPCIGLQFRVSTFAIHLLEKNKQDVDASGLPICSEIIVARLANIALDSSVTDRFKCYCMGVQSLNVDEKWQGAPFASMIRRSQTHDFGSNENILQIAFILHSTNSNVKEVKYSSIILQPIDLKVDEETLMRLVPFWRTSLSTSRTHSQQFYFKHFEIQPIKITATFLPGNPSSSYSSAQETLRSLLHSVIKVPAVNNKVVELNGILLTHAFVTFRELLIKCAKHYSWYVVRAVYIAKGSPLLPPAFASIFDDTASSSLDVFFDPSDGSISLPGLTLGMFKFISKCIDSKGFSGTKRYFGDLGKTIKIAGTHALFAAVTEISDSILKGAEASGFNGMVIGFHQGIMRLAMEPALLGAAVLEGGPDRKIKLDRSPGVDELYIEGYLQAMLDVMYKQEYLRVRVIDNQVVLKNLPPNSSVINEIVENVKSFLVSKALLKGDVSMASRPLRHLRTETEWRLGPTVLTLCEHLFVSFTIRMLRRHANRFTFGIRWKWNSKNEGEASADQSQPKSSGKWAVSKFIFSGLIAYLDGRLCRHIPNPVARRVVSGFLLSYLDNNNGK